MNAPGWLNRLEKISIQMVIFVGEKFITTYPLCTTSDTVQEDRRCMFGSKNWRFDKKKRSKNFISIRINVWPNEFMQIYFNSIHVSCFFVGLANKLFVFIFFRSFYGISHIASVCMCEYAVLVLCRKFFLYTFEFSQNYDVISTIYACSKCLSIEDAIHSHVIHAYVPAATLCTVYCVCVCVLVAITIQAYIYIYMQTGSLMYDTDSGGWWSA